MTLKRESNKGRNPLVTVLAANATHIPTWLQSALKVIIIGGIAVWVLHTITSKKKKDSDGK